MVAEPEEQRQQVGEICESCKPYWVLEQGHPENVKRLRALPGKTVVKGHEVPACPYCDGDDIFNQEAGKEPA